MDTKFWLFIAAGVVALAVVIWLVSWAFSDTEVKSFLAVPVKDMTAGHLVLLVVIASLLIGR